MPLWHSAVVGITPQQFERMKSRVNGARRVAGPVFTASPPVPERGPQIILGIDPSLRGTGFGVIRLSKPHPQTLALGTIVCPAGTTFWNLPVCNAVRSGEIKVIEMCFGLSIERIEIRTGVLACEKEERARARVRVRVRVRARVRAGERVI